MKKIMAVLAGPRKGWNTDKLVRKAAEGAKSCGAQVKYISLYQLEKFTGCISCFACKLPAFYGKCAYRDGLHDVLAEISEADGLIIASPIYLGDLSAGFRAFFERLVYPHLTYKKEAPCANDNMIPTLLIVTANTPEEMFDRSGYTAMLQRYERTLASYVGPVKTLVCGNTVQTNQYDRFNWTLFDAQDKIRHREETFALYEQKAYDMGKDLCA